jgi:hypothetical protein
MGALMRSESSSRYVVASASPAHGRGRQRAKLWLFRLCAVGLSLGLCAVAAEIVMRLRDRVRGPAVAAGGGFESVYAFSPTRHHRLIPNGRYQHSAYEFDYLWTNNALGMRDRERPIDKAPGTFRIFVLGDSFVQGHGVTLSDTLTMRLEASLNQPPRRARIEVLNGGVFGYSPFLEALYLREVIDTVRPDLVIVGFFLGNDVGEDSFYGRIAHLSSDGTPPTFVDREWPWSAIVDGLDEGPLPEADAPFADRLRADATRALHHLRLSTLLATPLQALPYPERRAREFGFVQQHRGDPRYDLGLINYPVGSRSERQAYWDISQRNLAAIAELCRAHGTQMMLLVIPPFERLTGETRFDEPYEVLDDFGGRLGIPVIELLPDFLSAQPTDLYYSYDRHWTPQGHERAAAVVDRTLRQLEVLPE